MKMFQVAQAAVNHLRRGRRRLRAAASLLEKRDVVIAASQLPRDPRAVDPAANDREPHAPIVPLFASRAVGLVTHAVALFGQRRVSPVRRSRSQCVTAEELSEGLVSEYRLRLLRPHPYSSSR